MHAILALFPILFHFFTSLTNYLRSDSYLGYTSQGTHAQTYSVGFLSQRKRWVKVTQESASQSLQHATIYCESQREGISVDCFQT